MADPLVCEGVCPRCRQGVSWLQEVFAHRDGDGLRSIGRTKFLEENGEMRFYRVAIDAKGLSNLRVAESAGDAGDYFKLPW